MRSQKSEGRGRQGGYILSGASIPKTSKPFSRTVFVELTSESLADSKAFGDPLTTAHSP